MKVFWRIEPHMATGQASYLGAYGGNVSLVGTPLLMCVRSRPSAAQAAAQGSMPIPKLREADTHMRGSRALNEADQWCH